MSAREAILAAIRDAWGAEPRPAVAVPREYAQPEQHGDLEVLVDRLVDYRAEVTRCTPTTLPEAVAAALSGFDRVVVPTGLEVEVAGGIPGEELTHADLDDCDAVVTTATVAIAATGTIILTHGPGQGRRALTLVPDCHVCIVTAGQVVADVPDAIGRLDPRRPMTWISGPSATSDIELSRVEGVHGPRRLHVILVG